ncbi:MAG: DUF4238 domain-containing protein [Bacilli bacterium]|nr:DUF4238 domain-containing protein [Bacilli bacterium]
MDDTKRQHYVPQTYLKAWCYSGDSLYIYKSGNDVTTKNKENIFKKNYLYSQTADMIYLTPMAKQKIFSLLDTYEVKYNGMLLDTYDKLHENYSFFDNWGIENNGIPLKKSERNVLKNSLSQAKDNFLENKWNTELENDWESFSKTLEDIFNPLIDEAEDISEKFNKDYFDKLFKYYLMFSFRSKEETHPVNEFFDFLKRFLPNDIVEELKKNWEIKDFIDFVTSNNNGTMNKSLENIINSCSFYFLVSSPSCSFITSETPCLTLNIENNIEKAFIISPKIAVIIGRLSEDERRNPYIKVQKLNTNGTQAYNNAILDKAVTVILPNNDIKNLFG